MISMAFSILHGETTTALKVNGGSVGVIVFDQNNPNIVYAGGQSGGGLSKSTNAGDTWTTILYPPVGQHAIQALIVSTKTANLVLFGEQGGTDLVIGRSA